MRRRGGYYSGYGTVATDHGSVELGETHATIRKGSGSTPLVVGILGREYDEHGKLTCVVLDSIVHDKWKTRIGDFEGWGCFVTELRPLEKGEKVY